MALYDKLVRKKKELSPNRKNEILKKIRKEYYIADRQFVMWMKIFFFFFLTFIIRVLREYTLQPTKSNAEKDDSQMYGVFVFGLVMLAKCCVEELWDMRQVASGKKEPKFDDPEKLKEYSVENVQETENWIKEVRKISYYGKVSVVVLPVAQILDMYYLELYDICVKRWPEIKSYFGY